MALDIPTIMTTKRLVIREPRLADKKDLMNALQENVGHMDYMDHNFPNKVGEETVDYYVYDRILDGDVVRLFLRNGDIIGSVMMINVVKPLPYIKKIGIFFEFWCRFSQRNNGYTTEAVEHLLSYVKNYSMTAVDVENSAALRVLDKVGFKVSVDHVNTPYHVASFYIA